MSFLWCRIRHGVAVSYLRSFIIKLSIIVCMCWVYKTREQYLRNRFRKVDFSYLLFKSRTLYFIRVPQQREFNPKTWIIQLSMFERPIQWLVWTLCLRDPVLAVPIQWSNWIGKVFRDKSRWQVLIAQIWLMVYCNGNHGEKAETSRQEKKRHKVVRNPTLQLFQTPTYHRLSVIVYGFSVGHCTSRSLSPAFAEAKAICKTAAMFQANRWLVDRICAHLSANLARFLEHDNEQWFYLIEGSHSPGHSAINEIFKWSFPGEN